jgi:heterodisulfide reductase subunit B
VIDVLQELGPEIIAQRVVASLEDCRPACYYGCLLTRPPSIVNFDDPECPDSMETLLQACGARPIDWNYRTKCCGAGMTLSNEETVLELSHEILADAVDHGATCLVVACPMCHVNLDMKQPAIERRYDTKLGLPVFYLTDLIGRAVGLDDATLGINRHFIAAG